MTDPERQAVNERIATAMHGKPREGAWVTPPDFFTDPKAADELKVWLVAHGFHYREHQVAGCDCRITVEKGLVRHSGHAPNWKAALTRAADAAIREAT